ncbi:hypothetical protein Nepgr_022261 [Nepenthes gracilis]|uniref:Uncharacterized protein n=1 Tax=Nepenthes gracilis TaxID=150966 RepID=A0AAD3SZ90_NEPGR|nr:hypothetical protein Nepgr_022261 [Nepenthes gracilis]
MRMKKEDIIRGLAMVQDKAADLALHVGKKVLPIGDPAAAGGASTSCSIEEKHEKKKGKAANGDDKIKLSMPGMKKELLRWASAAARSEKAGSFIGRKVLQFRNRRSLKEAATDDELSIESPKISLRWDAESCSTASSAISAPPSLMNYSTPPLDSRFGNWITTDSDFVVLEL